MSTYYTRSAGRIEGPYPVEAISKRIASGELSADAQAIEARGQSFYELQCSTKWVPVANVAVMPGPAAWVSYSSTHYRPCRDCTDFLVTKEDAYCPDCGILAPFPGSENHVYLAKKHEWIMRGLVKNSNLLSISAKIAIALQLICLIIYSANYGPWSHNALAVVWAIIVAEGGTVVSILVWIISIYISDGPDFLPTRSDSHLRATDKMIQRRLAEIKARQIEIAQTQARIAGEGSGDRWEKARELLAKSITMLARQRDNYEAQHWEIELIRWQNKLEPLASDLETINREEVDFRRPACAELQDEGRKLLEEATLVLPEGNDSLNHIREGIASAEDLRQELMAQEALVALRGVTPLDDVMNTQSVSFDRPDMFRARVSAMKEIANSFDVLEAEYQRMVAEEGLALGLKQS